MFAAAANRAQVVCSWSSRGAEPETDVDRVSPAASGSRRSNPNAPPPASTEASTDPVSLARAERRVGPATLGGWAALHFAAREGHIEAARALIEAGADINQPNDGDKTTPLVDRDRQRSLRSREAPD